MKCHVDQPLTVCERLLAVLPEGDPGMRPHGLQQSRDGLRDGRAVAAHMEPAR